MKRTMGAMVVLTLVAGVAAALIRQQVTPNVLAQSTGLGISVNNVTVVEGAAGATANATFTVSLSAPAAQAVSVRAASANASATAGSDYTALVATTLSFAPGERTKTVSVAVTGDSVPEGNETFVVDLSSPAGAALADAQGVAIILDEEGAPRISVDNVTVVEGGPGGTVNATFTVSLSTPAAQTVSVRAASANVTATAGSDYTALAATTLSFAPGERAKTVTVAVTGDSVAEGNETFVVNLSSPVGAVLADTSGLATILDEEGAPTVSVDDVTVVEGAAGTSAEATFTVSLSAPPALRVTVVAGSANITATAGSDYTALAATTLSFAPGETTKTVTVAVTGDSVAEGDETFVVNLSLRAGAVVADAQGVATLLDEEGTPTVSVDDVAVVEGAAGTTVNATFTVSLSAPAAQTVSVRAASANLTATAGSDYTALPATTLSFAPGERTKTVTVAVTGDSVTEGNETFVVNLSSPVGTLFADAQGVATIVEEAPEQKLTWAPPPLTNPTTITINSDVIKARGTDGHRWHLDNTKDYDIRVGTVNTSYGIVISGGRNVVIKGGYITIPWAGTYPDLTAAYRDMAKRRALLVANQTGTIHIEGLLIDNALGDLTEGIQIQSPNADIQIQNVRITDVHARDQVGYKDNHPDCIQPLGLKALRIDKFTCSTDGQAFYMDNGDGALGSVDIRRTNVWGLVNTYPFLFHRVQQNGAFPVTLSDVWVKPQPSDTLRNSVYNVLFTGGVYQNQYAVSISPDGTSASWPDPTITGVIRSATPAAGDFVPASSVGVNYVSPGYRT